MLKLFNDAARCDEAADALSAVRQLQIQVSESGWSLTTMPTNLTSLNATQAQ